MDDTIVLSTHSEMLDTECSTVRRKSVNLLATDWITDLLLLIRRCVVVWHRYDMVRTESLDSLVTQCIKCLR